MPRRRIAALALFVCLAVPACTQEAQTQHQAVQKEDADARACDRYQPVGVMRVPSVAALKRPREDAAKIARFPRINAQGAEQVFPILGDRYSDHHLWHEVMLPIRPNGSTGWIPASAVNLRRSDYRIEVDLRSFRLDLFERCDKLGSFEIGIGTRDTPTPKGTFFLNSLLEPPTEDSVYGALAFGLSAYSDVITDWEGGGIVGLHGTNDPSSLGREVSHGCIRMGNEAIRMIARRVPLGTIVRIS
jgi:lipoprotein-anchoring transpeptidase ErfK/SrfK